MDENINANNEQAQSKSKKRSCLKWIGIGVGGLLLLCIAFTAFGLYLSSTPEGRATGTAVAAARYLTETAEPTNTIAPSKTPKPTRTTKPSRTPEPTNTLRPSDTPTETPTETTTPTPEIDQSVKAIMNGAGLNQADAEVAFAVIKSVGFERVESLEFGTQVETMKGYVADLGYTRNYIITFDGNQIFGISDGNELVLYDRDAGGALDNINNYVLDITEKGLYIALTQEYVKASLKAPSTAKFPGLILELDQWKVSRNKDVVWVQSWVDAQNSFGAMLRNDFTAQFSYNTQELLYLELGGEVMYGSAQ